MTTDVLARIRTACAQVTAQATSVHIDHDQLGTFADTLLRPDGQVAGEDPGRQRIGDDESAAAFVITLDAINFGSGYFPYLRKRDGMSGYHTVAAALRERVTSHGPITGAWLRTVDVATCNEIFDQPDTELAQELMGLFAAALRDLGVFVDGFDDSFVAFVRSSHHSAANLVEQLDRMPFFRDVATYRGLSIPIYKRAQITAFDLAQAFAANELGRFDDLPRLTMFADNLVPHVLRVDGVLRFSDDLVARIDRVDDIEAGSEPEVEIRAVGLHAVELLQHAVTSLGASMTSGEIDSVLWNRGAGARYKAIPRHRSRTVFY
ncbi:MAG: queuosine salvage family protein [Acidimicrobiales bacterium]